MIDDSLLSRLTWAPILPVRTQTAPANLNA
jgi:hypothetical protein